MITMIAATVPPVADVARVRIGAGYKLLPAAPVKDAGRVTLGAGYKLLPRA